MVEQSQGRVSQHDVMIIACVHNGRVVGRSGRTANEANTALFG